MKRFTLCVAALGALLGSGLAAQAESIIPPTYYTRLYLQNTQHQQHRNLFRAQALMQQLRQVQAQRALQGLPPTRQMAELERRLDLYITAQEQMLRGTGRAIRQNRSAEAWWDWSHGRWPFGW